MKSDNSIKIKLYIIALLIITGLSLLYLNSNANQNILNYDQEKTSITVIDLTKKKNNFSVYFFIGIGLITIATILSIKTFFTKYKGKPILGDKLTNQEAKVASLIKEFKTNKEIAIELSISQSTVKSHINNIYKKLEVKSRQELLELY